MEALWLKEAKHHSAGTPIVTLSLPLLHSAKLPLHDMIKGEAVVTTVMLIEVKPRLFPFRCIMMNSLLRGHALL
jgi:hypothetical protein